MADAGAIVVVAVLPGTVVGACVPKGKPEEPTQQTKKLQCLQDQIDYIKFYHFLYNNF